MSVRSLCELCLRSGDIDSRYGTGFEDAQTGADIHRTLQKEAGGFYNAEVPLSATTLFDGLYYTVSGRADGIIRTDGGLTVDEIKCVKPYAFFRPPPELWLGQLKCYAYFLCVRDGLDSVRARLTYFNVETKKTKYFNFNYSFEYLKEYYLKLLESVSFFGKLCAKRQVEVLPQAANAVFPYSGLREGQAIMIRECYGAIKDGKRLFVEAPTGTGKTISSLYPAILSLGKGRVDKVFYLTAKASVRREAFAASSRLFSAGVPIRAVVLNSKESMCENARRCGTRNLCNPDDCPRARGYYGKLNTALVELLEGYNGYPAKTVKLVADKYGMCPYELSLDLSEYCDIIICDYNYAFDPSVYLRRYFGEGGRREKYAFLIDEAHNLADRARGMYSAELALSHFKYVSGLCSAMDGLVCDVMTALCKLSVLCTENRTRDESGNDRGYFLGREPLENLNIQLELFRKRADTYMKKNADSEHYDALYSLCSEVKKYLSVSEYFGKGFLTYGELDGEELRVKIFCLDPSRIMDKLLMRARSAVMFSATLTPPEYFCDVLGSNKNSVSVCLPSPFDTDNLCVAVVDGMGTRFSERDANVRKFVSVIAATVSVRSGNYMVYFPSYDCMEKVHKLFKAKYPRVVTVLQSRGMTPGEREAFLSSFRNDEGRTRIGFCVLGGAFSEGVDLPEKRLIGAIIFGVGLPMLSNERNIIRDYFDERSENGYDYAYTYPGMNNALQAAGRVIRTENDKGVVVLVDDRYATPQYRKLFPEHWKGVQYAGNAPSLAEILRRFWKNGG